MFSNLAVNIPAQTHNFVFNETREAQPSPVINQEENSNPDFWDKAQSLAELVCSRESIFRAALDITGWELPNIVASASRNIYSFYESIFQTALTTVLNVGAPYFTKKVGELVGSRILTEDEKPDLHKYMLFQLKDLEDEESFKRGIQRIIHEEPEDILFNAMLSKQSPEKLEKIKAKAQAIKDFFSKLEYSEDLFNRVKKLKRQVIVGESAVEGIGWGAFLPMIRMFRKHVLGQNRFTGTMKYESDEESKKLGDAGDMKWWQKGGTGFGMVVSPLLNNYLLNKIEDKEAVANSKILQIVKDQWDMTHGIFPKLGLMLSFIQVPATIGRFFSAQGKAELYENMMILGGMVPSWWFGHRVTNGWLAKLADGKFAKKHGIEPGIFLEKKDLDHPAPDPAKIHHVINTTKHDPVIEKDARRKHAQILYGGFTMHSALVFCVRMLINQVTKWRVDNKLKN